MAKHLYLPQLSNTNVSETKESGLWEKRERNIIQTIANDIAISEAEQSRGISSVPDIWARPIMFQTAVRSDPNKPHPLRQRAVQEWRGLLSLLALAQIKRYSISIAPVKLKENNDKFSRALKNLAPAAVQLEKDFKYEWTDVFIIYFDQIPVGAFSPTTLVYTATDYNREFSGKDIPLQDGEGYLAPPAEDDDLRAVGKWLSNVKKRIDSITDGSESNKDHSIILVIKSLIDEWLEELQLKFNDQIGVDIKAENIRISEDIIETIDERLGTLLSRYKVYNLLLKPLVEIVEGVQKYHSAMSLELEKGRNRKSYNEVVVITKKLLEKNLKIWDTWKLNDFGGDSESCLEKYFDGESGNRIDRVDIEKYNAIWIRPEKYFLTNKLLCGKTVNFLTDSEEEYNFSRKYVLPFKKEILDFYTPEQIKDLLKPCYKEESDGVKFSFQLPIVNGVTEKVEKYYKTKDLWTGEPAVFEVDPPMIELFPRYMDKNWRRYYLFNDRANEFQIRPLIDHENPRVISREHNVTMAQDNYKVEISEITCDNAFPEAIEITDLSQNNNLAGIILIARPIEPRELSKEWTIGIDLGTSNTNLLRQSSREEMAQNWNFDLKKYFRTLTVNNSDYRDQVLEHSFIPDRDIELPIPTMIRIFDSTQKTNLIVDYFIHFSSNYNPPDSVYSDIKWEEEEKKTKYFIESLLFLIFLEAVDKRVLKIVLACSYPKAFSKKNEEVLKQEWKQALDKLVQNEETSILRAYNAVDKEPGKVEIANEPFFEIEGKAAGKFFASEKTIDNVHDRANIAIAAICLDVGGGTTDISIWNENKIVADASVLLAGRQISQLFQKNAPSRDLLFSKEATIALEKKLNEPTYFAARLNYILKKEESRIKQLLLDLSNTSELKWLHKMLTLEFCALSYYTAVLAIATDRILNTSILARIQNAGIALHWGGNAAKFLNWVNFGSYDKKSTISKMLNGVFFKAVNDEIVKPKKLDQLQSPGHKREVAGGLVVMNLQRGDKKDDGGDTSEYDIDEKTLTTRYDESVGIISGEVIELKDKTIDYLDPISNKDLFGENSESKFISTGLEKLKRFLDIFNLFGLKFGLFNEDEKIKLSEGNEQLIKDEVYASFVTAKNLKESERIIEPIFILEMRKLLEILRDEMR